MEQSKTHYRKIAKSDHLGCADLEDFIEEKKSLIFTITHVKQEIGVSVAGKKGNFNIAYFKEKIKPLVLNSTNSKVLKSMTNGSPFVEDWVNLTIEMFIDETVRMKGELVGGVRIKPSAFVLPQLPSSGKAYDNAIEYVRQNGHTEGIEQRYTLTDETRQKLFNDAK